jgi:hypothetical protein
MHRKRLYLGIFAGLVFVGLWGSGFAVAHGASGGNGSAGHGAGHGHSHHRAASHGERGFSGRIRRGGGEGGWVLPGYGFYFVSIPSYCKLIYWDGVPYYYADDVYYEWNGSVGAYEQVQPPAGLAERIISQAPALRDLFVFPNGDQTIEQLERDREECQRWAADQVGVDPKVPAKRAPYLRADGACLEARDYSVE